MKSTENFRSRKVFGIGLSRTGTTTLSSVLAQMGLKSIHYCEFLMGDCPDWERCNAWDALGDAPIPLYYQALDARFPDSLFILTTRDKTSWLRSMKWMYSHGEALWGWGPETHQYLKQFYGTARYNRAQLERHWDAYHAGVREYFRTQPERYMEIHLNQGFDTDAICRFLGIEPMPIRLERENQRRDLSLKSLWAYRLRKLLRGLKRG